MMRKSFRKIPLLLAVCGLAFSLVLAGCGGSGSPASDPPPHPIVGTWFLSGDPPVTYTFRANGTLTTQTNGFSFDGTWSASGNQLTLTGDGTFQFHISGNTLTIYFDGPVPFIRQQ